MSRQFKLSFMDRILTFPGSAGHLSYDTGENKITYLETENGSISGDKEWALPDEVVTLSNTPDQDYIIDEYYVNGSAISGNTFLMPNEDVDVSAMFKEAGGYTITLLTDGNGTISADKILCPIGETVNLSTTYNDYYRFNNYSVSGGTVNGNVLTPTENCTVKANFKLNSFVASGNFEKGSNADYDGQTGPINIRKYCVRTYSTSNVPSSWYSSSSRWNPVASDLSGYSITVNGKMGFRNSQSVLKWAPTLKNDIIVGSTHYDYASIHNSNSQATVGRANWYYNKTRTTNVIGLASVSAQIVHGEKNGGGRYSMLQYVASATNGTWKATGVIK